MAFFGVASRNAEQKAAMQALINDKPFTFITGPAGGGKTSVTYGNEIGNTCPVCREGEVREIGGCNTCVNCSAQLKCGL